MSVALDTAAELKEVFEKQNLRRVAIIDDAYIAVPTRAAFERDNRLTVLLENIQKWETPLPDFADLPRALDSDDALTDKLIRELYLRKSDSAEIEQWFKETDGEQRESKKLLESLETILSKDLACDVQQLTPDQEFDPQRLPELIFVDYFLDRGDRVEHSLELAGNIGDRIAAAYPTEKPLVVLMSSKDSIDALKKSNFIEKAKLLGGLFHFVPKADLRRTPTFFIKLAILVRSKSDGRRVQEFIQELNNGVATSVSEFTRTVSALSLEDYGYIQQLSLQGEGMALGDYLLWLFGTYFSHSLMKAAPKQKTQMDRMVFTNMPDADGAPSKDFVDLFARAVSEEVEDLGIHPRSDITDKAGQVWAPPDPHFGDVFTDEKCTEALMVITPECDLIYAPEIEANRNADPERSVLMLPGSMQESDGFAHECRGIQTSLVQLGTKRYVIDWDLKKAKVAAMGSLRQFMADRRLKRKIRLKHPFSAWAQMAYLGDASRIPVPVGPPIVTPIGATIHFEIDGQRKQLEVGGTPAVTYIARSGDHYLRPKVNLVSKLLEVAEQVHADRAKKLATLVSTSNDWKKCDGQLRGMQEFLTKLALQEELLVPFVFSSGVQVFGKISSEFVKDGAKFEGKSLNKALTILIHPMISHVAG